MALSRVISEISNVEKCRDLEIVHIVVIEHIMHIVHIKVIENGIIRRSCVVSY